MTIENSKKARNRLDEITLPLRFFLNDVRVFDVTEDEAEGYNDRNDRRISLSAGARWTTF